MWDFPTANPFKAARPKKTKREKKSDSGEAKRRSLTINGDQIPAGVENTIIHHLNSIYHSNSNPIEE
jgi:hypothetical protein